MNSSLIARRDLDFLLHDWLKIETLAARAGHADLSRESVDAMLDLSEKLAREQFLTHYKQADIEEPHQDAEGNVHICPAVTEALRQYAEVGLFSAGFDPELGGLGLPYTVSLASFALFASANVATVGYAMLTVANARLIATFGSPAQVEHFARPQIDGRWFGTMCLSEPQAGSSLADVRTRAEPAGSDELGNRYRLVGNKMWISGGDHDASENIVHLVLAKVPDAEGRLPEGTAGLSLFIVPKRLPDGTRNDLGVAGLNHKMGYRGTANCLLNFGERSGAIGWMVGTPGLGLAQMFQMMNEARIGVGMGAAALGYRGYRLSVTYARERLQGRAIGVRSGAPVPLIEHADIKRMLLAQKAYAEGAVALCLYCARLVDDEDNAASTELLGLLTPVAKTWPSEYGIAANDIAIQVHGGYGYTRDFDVEQLLRDNRLNPIHEGTTGIQAIDLLGRKILRDGGAGLAEFARRVADCVARSKSVPALGSHGAALERAVARIHETLQSLRANAPAAAFDNATPFLWAFGHVVVSWLWLDQALAAQALAASAGDERALVAGKLRACRYFFECELPKIEAWLAIVASGTDVAAGAPAEIF